MVSRTFGSVTTPRNQRRSSRRRSSSSAASPSNNNNIIAGLMRRERTTQQHDVRILATAAGSTPPAAPNNKKQRRRIFYRNEDAALPPPARRRFFCSAQCIIIGSSAASILFSRHQQRRQQQQPAGRSGAAAAHRARAAPRPAQWWWVGRGGRRRRRAAPTTAAAAAAAAAACGHAAAAAAAAGAAPPPTAPCLLLGMIPILHAMLLITPPSSITSCLGARRRSRVARGQPRPLPRGHQLPRARTAADVPFSGALAPPPPRAGDRGGVRWRSWMSREDTQTGAQRARHPGADDDSRTAFLNFSVLSQPAQGDCQEMTLYIYLELPPPKLRPRPWLRARRLHWKKSDGDKGRRRDCVNICHELPWRLPQPCIMRF